MILFCKHFRRARDRFAAPGVGWIRVVHNPGTFYGRSPRDSLSSSGDDK